MKSWFRWSVSLLLGFIVYNYFIDYYFPVENPAFYFWKRIILAVLLLSLYASALCILFVAIWDCIKSRRTPQKHELTSEDKLEGWKKGEAMNKAVTQPEEKYVL
ncbi:MAG: hypothetical protein Q7R89_00525 [bacterium]|nr:hypothetical protein [bacterium]